MATLCISLLRGAGVSDPRGLVRRAKGTAWDGRVLCGLCLVLVPVFLIARGRDDGVADKGWVRLPRIGPLPGAGHVRPSRMTTRCRLAHLLLGGGDMCLGGWLGQQQSRPARRSSTLFLTLRFSCRYESHRAP